MSKIYSISVDDTYASVLYLEQTRKSISLIDENLLDVSELDSSVGDKESIYISVEQDFIIDEQVELPAAIKNKSTIKNYIHHHLKKNNPDKEILFNYQKLSSKSDEEKSLYQVDAVDEKSFTAALSIIKNPQRIKIATLPKFALLAISNQCVNAKSYISVYTSGSKILVLAIHEKQILFSRSNVVTSPTPESLQMDITGEINQTVSYIQQQYRDIHFSLIVLSGKLALDDTVAQQLIMLNTLPLAVLYPNHLVSNLQQEDGHAHILSIGNLFVSKDYHFLPRELAGLKQFRLLQNASLVISSLLLLTVAYYTFDEYRRYSDLLERYHIIKNRLLDTVKHTKTLPQDELEKTLTHLDLAKKHLSNHPTDLIILLRPLIFLQKPSSWVWSKDMENVTLNVKFEKKFTTLAALHDFEMRFNKLFKDINTSKYNLQNINATEYDKLYFKTEIQILSSQYKNSQSPVSRVQ